MMRYGLPPKQGLYDPSLEHDACGIGFVADLKNPASHAIVEMGTEVLCRLGSQWLTPKSKRLLTRRKRWIAREDSLLA